MSAGTPIQEEISIRGVETPAFDQAAAVCGRDLHPLQPGQLLTSHARGCREEQAAQANLP